MFRPAYLKTLVYMAQSTDYNAKEYLRWFWRTSNFARIMYRRTLEMTTIAQRLVRFVLLASVIQVVLGIVISVYGFMNIDALQVFVGLATIATYPVVVAHSIVVPLWAGQRYVITPQRKKLLADAEKIFVHHKGKRIAIVGSYGKTSMKELLLQVLGEGLKVVATPGNKNVLVSHAAFARSLRGDEDIVIIEYGEGAPGDVAKFAELTHPTHAVITGVAPAHLDQYVTVEAARQDIFSVTNYLPADNVYINRESGMIGNYTKGDFIPYDRDGALGWKIQAIKVEITGLTFEMSKENQLLVLHSKLLGRHNLGPLALVAALAVEHGMSTESVQAAVEATKPYEHRMQPYQLSGAWIIDDTYNGNIEGIRAGTALLHELSSKRKIYVSPGLVDQGEETEAVHHEMGTLIASAEPDIVILMQNSVTRYIQSGLAASGYAGEVRIETDPLGFYQNLSHFVAVGDIVLMQNDWTDNYH